jgi:hypothetical protein
MLPSNSSRGHTSGEGLVVVQQLLDGFIVWQQPAVE